MQKSIYMSVDQEIILLKDIKKIMYECVRDAGTTQT